MFLKNNIRPLLVVSKENGLEKPLGTITPLDFLWYKEQARRMILENGDDMIDAILEYYRYLHWYVAIFGTKWYWTNISNF